MQQQAAGAAAAALGQLPPALLASTSVPSMYRIPAVLCTGSQQTYIGMVASTQDDVSCA